VLLNPAGRSVGAKTLINNYYVSINNYCYFQTHTAETPKSTAARELCTEPTGRAYRQGWFL